MVIPGKLNPEAPDDMYAAMGKNAQLLNVVPSENLIWVRMGDAPSGSGGLVSPIFNNDVWKKINALKCGNLSVRDENYSGTETLLYPNPAENIINIKSDKIIREFEIYNAAGQIILKMEIHSVEYVLNLSGFEKGNYTITFLFDDKSSSGKHFSKIN